MTIAQASENTIALLGHSAPSLLDQPIGKVLGAEEHAKLSAFVASEPIDRNPLYVFTVPGIAGELDVTVHSNGYRIILEFEPAGTGGARSAAPDFYGLIKKTVVRLQSAAGLLEFCDIAAQEVRALTGLDRVMIYKFHADGHGEVFAESRVESLAPWLGLHYPAGDIPQPAREMFKRIWVRPVPDVAGALAEMVPLADPDTGAALDMTHCALRGASVMYTEYLQNMLVTAGLTMPIRRGNELWGLIACHHYGGPLHLPYPVRVACEFLAQVVSLQHKAAEDREHMLYRLQLEDVHRRLIATAALTCDLSRITEGQLTLLDAVQAGGAALYEAGRWWHMGRTPSDDQLDGLVRWLATRPEYIQSSSPMYATDHLAKDYPAGASLASVAAGMFALPLARGLSAPHGVMMWFKPETMQTIQWGGNPHEKPTVTGPHGPRLTPRVSFEMFAESVHHRSLPWQSVEIESAARLRVLLMELVVARAERLADLNADLMRSNEELDTFAYVASHDLKEPLRGIHKYAHQLLEDAAMITADRQVKLASLMRLTERMDSLLDSLLHFSRVGRLSLELEPSDLNVLVSEAIEMVGSRRDDMSTEFIVPRPMPTIYCDWVRCREIYVNLLSNAMKYNDNASKRIEIGWIAPGEAPQPPGRTPNTSDSPTFYVRDNGIGIDSRYHTQVFKIFKRLHPHNAYGGGSGAGLSIVKKLVERHHGNVWFESTPGEGSTFYFTMSGSTGDRT